MWNGKLVMAQSHWNLRRGSQLVTAGRDVMLPGCHRYGTGMMQDIFCGFHTFCLSRLGSSFTSFKCLSFMCCICEPPQPQPRLLVTPVKLKMELIQWCIIAGSLGTTDNPSMYSGIYQSLRHMLIFKIERHAKHASVAPAATC